VLTSCSFLLASLL